MKRQKPKVVPARRLRAMKHASQKRDRELITKDGADRSMFLIDPYDAKKGTVQWPDVDLD